MRLGLIGLGRIGAFHTNTLVGIPAIDSLVVTDLVPEKTKTIVERFGAQGVEGVDSLDALLGSGVDGVIIAAGTDAHTKLILACVEAGLPTLCEKPVGSNGAEGAELLRRLQGSTVPVQIGFQRRYDAAIAAAKEAVDSGELGWINTIRSTTLDPEPPTEAYVAVSGGMYRDCGVHDFDIIRFVTGQEAVEVYATGTNQGAEFFKKYDDPDTSAAIVTFANGTLGVVSNTRYNGRGYDVRLEVHGSKDSVAAGVDEGWPIRALQPGRRVPVRAAAPVLHGPFPARVPRGVRDVPRGRRREAAVAVHRRRRAGGGLDRRGMCQVPEGAPSGAHRGGTDSMSTETTAVQDRRRADLLGRLRGARLGLPARPGQGPRRDARGRAARHRARTRRLPAGRAGRDGHRARAARAAGRRRVHPAAAARARATTRCPRSSGSSRATSRRTPRPWCCRRSAARTATTAAPSSTTRAGRRCWTTSAGSARSRPSRESAPSCTRTSAR